MKSKFVCALVIAALGSLMAASLADAHYLSGNKAYRIAERDTAFTAREIGNGAGTNVDWAVRRPCSQRAAHRWVCDAACRASRTSYAIRTKAVGSNCFRD